MRKIGVISSLAGIAVLLFLSHAFALDKAELAAPGNGDRVSVGEEVEFKWLPVEGTSQYMLGVTGPGRKQEGRWLYDVCVYKLSFDKPGKYYWRIAVGPGTRNETTSLERYFIVE